MSSGKVREKEAFEKQLFEELKEVQHGWKVEKQVIKQR